MSAARPTNARLRFTLSPSRRLRLSGDFRRVYTLRASAADGRLVVYARPNGLTLSRLGVSVGKKHGNSVCRSRIKRLLREAFRLSRHDLPEGYDFVLIPRGALTLSALRDALPALALRAARRADRKLAARPPGEGA